MTSYKIIGLDPLLEHRFTTSLNALLCSGPEQTSLNQADPSISPSHHIDLEYRLYSKDGLRLFGMGFSWISTTSALRRAFSSPELQVGLHFYAKDLHLTIVSYSTESVCTILQATCRFSATTPLQCLVKQ